MASADALVHEPQLIILDEPTIGLDPNQIRSVRQLIKNLAGQHTVLISTHILHEVDMTCSRVLILDKGRILAHDTPDNLRQLMSEGGQVIAEIAAPEADLRLLGVGGGGGTFRSFGLRRGIQHALRASRRGREWTCVYTSS